MPDVAKGVITKGLAASHGNVIIGYFNLGFEFVVEIEVHGGHSLGGTKGLPGDKRKLITITITSKTRKWQKTYLVNDSKLNILIKIGNIINTITTNINVRVANLRKLLGKIRIKK